MEWDPAKATPVDKAGKPLVKADEAWDPEKATPVEPRGSLAEIAAGFRRAGPAFQHASAATSAGAQEAAGQPVDAFTQQQLAESKAALEANAPSPKDQHNWLTRAAAGAPEAIAGFAPMALAQWAGNIGGSVATPVAGVVAGSAAMGAQQYAQTYHEQLEAAREAGKSEDEAVAHAQKSAALSGTLGAGFGAIPLVGGPLRTAAKLVGIGAKPAGIEAAAKAAAGVAAEKTMPRALAEHAIKGQLGLSAYSVLGGVGQNVINESTGLPSTGAGEAALEGLKGSLEGGLAFAPFWGKAAHHDVKTTKALNTALTDPAIDPVARAKAARTVHDAIADTDTVAANHWANNAADAIEQGKPIGFTQDWMQPDHPTLQPPPPPESYEDALARQYGTNIPVRSLAEQAAFEAAQKRGAGAPAPFDPNAYYEGMVHTPQGLLPSPDQITTPRGIATDAGIKDPLAQANLEQAAGDKARALYAARDAEDARQAELARTNVPYPATEEPGAGLAPKEPKPPKVTEPQPDLPDIPDQGPLDVPGTEPHPPTQADIEAGSLSGKPVLPTDGPIVEAAKLSPHPSELPPSPEIAKEEEKAGEQRAKVEDEVHAAHEDAQIAKVQEGQDALVEEQKKRDDAAKEAQAKLDQDEKDKQTAADDAQATADKAKDARGKAALETAERHKNPVEGEPPVSKKDAAEAVEGLQHVIDEKTAHADAVREKDPTGAEAIDAEIKEHVKDQKALAKHAGIEVPEKEKLDASEVDRAAGVGGEPKGPEGAGTGGPEGVAAGEQGAAPPGEAAPEAGVTGGGSAEKVADDYAATLAKKQALVAEYKQAVADKDWPKAQGLSNQINELSREQLKTSAVNRAAATESNRDAYLRLTDEWRQAKNAGNHDLADQINDQLEARRKTPEGPLDMASVMTDKELADWVTEIGKKPLPDRAANEELLRRMFPRAVQDINTANADNPFIFSSGMTAPKDYPRALAAHHDMSIDLGLLSQPSIPKIADHMVNSDAHLFIDTGAYRIARENAKRAKEGKPPLTVDFDKVFAKLEAVEKAIADAGDKTERGESDANDRLFFSMPDIVGDQQGSLDLLRKYRDKVLQLVKYAPGNAIIPLQGGPKSLSEAFREVKAMLGDRNGLTIGIPSKIEGVSAADLHKLIVEHGHEIGGIHILGAGSVKSGALEARLQTLRDAGFRDTVTADSTRIRKALAAGNRDVEMAKMLGTPLPRHVEPGKYPKVDPNKPAPEVVNGKEPPKTVSDPRERLLCIACSAMKADTEGATKPAIEVYTGSMWQTLKKELQGVPHDQWPTILVMSGKHGLIDATTLIKTYDKELTRDNADKTIKRGVTLPILDSLDLQGKTLKDVFFVGNPQYARVFQSLIHQLKEGGDIAPEAAINRAKAVGPEGAGSGYMRQDLAGWVRNAVGKSAGEPKAAGKPEGKAETTLKNRKAVEDLVAEETAKLGHPPDVEILSKLSDLKDVKNADGTPLLDSDGAVMSAIKGGATAYGLYANGKVYLFANELKTKADVLFHLNHELGHNGFDNVLGKRREQIFQRIYDSNPEVQRQAQTYIDEEKYSPARAAEEVLADRSGHGDYKDIKGWQLLWSEIKAGLRRMGIDMKFSDEDVAHLVAKARRSVEGKGAAGEARLSTGPTPVWARDAGVRRGDTVVMRRDVGDAKAGESYQVRPDFDGLHGVAMITGKEMHLPIDVAQKALASKAMERFNEVNLSTRSREETKDTARHRLDVERGERKTGKGVITDAESKVIKDAVAAHGVSEKEVRERVQETKDAHPTDDGWAPLELMKVKPSLDEDKNVKLDKEGKPKLDYVYTESPYGFSNDAEGKALTPGTPEYRAHVRTLATRMTAEVRKVFKRMESGDKTAETIIGQASWYREMRNRLRHEFGGLGDLFADLLGATSPNTPVRDNWKNAVDFMRRASKGDFDELMPKWEAWKDNVDAAETKLSVWYNEEVKNGRTKADINASPEFKEKYAELAALRELPDELLPRKDTGKKYGFNGQNTVRAAVDLWRTVRNADPDIGRGPTAPKALNFSGNLIGFRSRATIDVWAARFLQRMAKLDRIPSVAEDGVTGAMRESGDTTLQFGLGQDVFHAAARMVRDDKSMKVHDKLKELGDDDLQAVVWFIEKELWAKNRWTSKEGEAGSFELEADLTGSAQQDRITDLRQTMSAGVPKKDRELLAGNAAAARVALVAHNKKFAKELRKLAQLEAIPEDERTKADKKDIRQLTMVTKVPKEITGPIKLVASAQGRVETKAAGRLAAGEELNTLVRSVDRWQGGLSEQMSKDGQGIDYVPPDTAMAKLQQDLMKTIYSATNSAKVLASKVLSTLGRYGDSAERSIDLEVSTREGFDPHELLHEMIKKAQGAKQDSMFLSRVLRAVEKPDMTRHRPGVEIYFRGAEPAEVEAAVKKALADSGYQGYTVIVDGRRSSKAMAGEMPGTVGVRFQYVPELDARFGDKTLVGKADAEIAEHMEAKGMELDDLADTIAATTPGVSSASRLWYDTEVVFAHEYQERIDALADRIAGKVDRPAGGEVWQGRKVRDGVAAAVDRTEVASREAGEGGTRPEPGDVPRGDAGQVTPEAKTPGRDGQGEPMLSSRKRDWTQDPSVTPAARAALPKVGIGGPTVPLKDRAKGLMANAELRITQKLVDQFRALKDLVDDTGKNIGEIPYMLARLTKSSDAVVESLLHYGTPFINSAGAVGINAEKGGFIGRMQQLKGEHERFFAWIAGNRAEQLKRENRENLLTDDNIVGLKTLNEGDMPDGSSRAQLYDTVHKELNRYSKTILDMAEKAGTINAKDRKVWEKDFYVPFFRVMEDGAYTGPKNVAGLTGQTVIKRLKGGTNVTKDLMHNTLRNWSHLIDASLKNQAAAVSLKTATDAGVAYPIKAGEHGKKDPFVLVNGERQYYRVEDPYVLEAISALEASPFSGAIPQLMSRFKQALTLGVTAGPSYRLRNLLRDSIQAAATNDMSFNLLKNLNDGRIATNKNNPIYAQMMAGGGLMHFGTGLEGDTATHTKRLINAGIKDADILNTPEKIKGALGKALDWWEDTGSRAENINRAAIYKQTYENSLKEGKTADEAHLYAAFAARDSMDFSLQGASPTIRLLSQIVPFFNARAQGMYKLGREGFAPAHRVIYNTVTGKPVSASDKSKAARFASVVGGVTLAGMGLYLAYRDDKDFQQREEWDRDQYWWFKVGDKALRIPRPFEVGALASVAERGLEAMMDGMDKPAQQRLTKSLQGILMNNLSMDPTPQLFKPALEVKANKSSFTGRPIETPGMERLSPAERIGPNTSAVAQLAGKANILSPVQIDSLIQGYLGWLGSHAAMTADFGLRPLMGLPSQPARRVNDYFVVGDWVQDVPSNQSRFLTQFYDQATTFQQALADYRHAVALGEFEKAKQISVDQREQLQQAPIYMHAQKALSQIGVEMRRVQLRTNLDPEEKRRRLDELSQRKNQLAEQVVTRHP